MGIQFRIDYTYLFSSFYQSKGSSNSLAGLTGLLSDYSSIKSGSYGKLMKAYYAETKNDTADDIVKAGKKNSSTVTREDAQKLNKVQTATDAMKESADALYETGSKSLFKQKDVTVKDEDGVETTVKAYDKDGVYDAVSRFVKDYNAVLDAADSAGNTNVTNRVNNMVNSTLTNEKGLNAVGITVGTDGSLSVDKEAFLSADMNKVKSLFNGSGSYGYQMSAQASMIHFSAQREASKAVTYTVNGSYNSFMNTGSLYNSYF